jgi:fructokinase
MYTIIGLGEVLWDIFEDGKVLGGAPANFAYHVHRLGHTGLPFSRVGTDPLGKELITSLDAVGLCTGFIQRDPDHPTGQVHVELDDEGVPDFTIMEEVAWDYMRAGRRWVDAARGADAICFGSLCQRSPESREAIRTVLDAAADAVLVFDVNLRHQFYSRPIITDSLDRCTVLKLNLREVAELRQMLELGGTERELIRDLMDDYEIDLVCVTRGENGCSIYTSQEQTDSSVPPIQVVDTVGSGDAFSAGLTIKYLDGSPPQSIARGANLLGAHVARCRGAMPDVPQQVIEQFNSA